MQKNNKDSLQIIIARSLRGGMSHRSPISRPTISPPNCNQNLVPRHLPMQHNLLPVIIDVDDRITPTEIRV